MRGIAVAALAAAALAACGTGSATTSDTALTVTYWAMGVGNGEPVRWTLRCDPARGTLERPAVACRKLADSGMRLFAPVSDRAVCTQIYGGPQAARVTGTFRGKRLGTTFTRTNGCQISRWNRVSPWLLPPAGTT